MANRDNGILLPDTMPSVDVTPDFTTGLVTLTIRMPFAVEPIECRVPIVDYLESAAGIITEMCALQRAAALHRS